MRGALCTAGGKGEASFRGSAEAWRGVDALSRLLSRLPCNDPEPHDMLAAQ